LFCFFREKKCALFLFPVSFPSVSRAPATPFFPSLSGYHRFKSLIFYFFVIKFDDFLF